MKYAVMVLMLSLPLVAQEHKFLDKTATFSLAGSAAIFSTDAIITCHNIGVGQWEERWLPTHSCAGVGAWMAGSFASQVGTSYFLHKTGHHRLERIAELFWASGSAIGITYNLKHPPKTLPLRQPTEQPTIPPIGIPCGTGCQL